MSELTGWIYVLGAFVTIGALWQSTGPMLGKVVIVAIWPFYWAFRLGTVLVA